MTGGDAILARWPVDVSPSHIAAAIWAGQSLMLTGAAASLL